MSQELTELLLELRNIRPELDPAKILSESASYLTKYPFLGADNAGMFRTSRFTLYSDYGLTTIRKAKDYFYGNEQQEIGYYEKVTHAFILQYLCLLSLEHSGSLTYFLGRFLTKPEICSVHVHSSSAGPTKISFSLGSNDASFSLDRDVFDGLIYQYEALGKSLSEYLNISVNDVPAEGDSLNGTRAGFLKAITIRDNRSGREFDLIDDAVEELKDKPDVQSGVLAIQESTVATARLIRKDYKENSDEHHVLALFPPEFMETGEADSFVCLIVNLIAFMQLSNLLWAYYVPSLSSRAQVGDVGYTFFVASVCKELRKPQTDSLSLIAGFLGSLVALIEQYRIAEDVKWRQIGLRTLHQIKTEIKVAAKKIRRYLKHPEKMLLEDSAELLERIYQRAESIVIFEKKKFGAAKRRDTKIESLRAEVEKILKDLLASADPRIHPSNRRSFAEALSDESYKKWVRVNGTEIPIAIEESFEIGLRELLLNCVEHTRERMDVNIDYRDAARIRIKIVNSEAIVPELLEYINAYPNREIGHIDIGFGLPTILETLTYCNVKYSVQVSSSQETVGILEIPTPGGPE